VWPDGIAHRRVRLAVTGVKAIYVVDKAVAISIEDGEVNVVFLFGDRI
jgi:methylthioribose-1-phosphate isomerase